MPNWIKYVLLTPAILSAVGVVLFMAVGLPALFVATLLYDPSMAFPAFILWAVGWGILTAMLYDSGPHVD